MATGIPSPSHSEAFFHFVAGTQVDKRWNDDNNRVFRAMHGIMMFAFFNRDERSWGAIVFFHSRLLPLVLYLRN